MQTNESCLIDKDDALRELRAYAERKHNAGHVELSNGILKAVNYIRNNIVRVDAVQILRCKECKYFDAAEGYTHIDGFCNRGYLAIGKKASGYCDMGEGKSINMPVTGDCCCRGENTTLYDFEIADNSAELVRVLRYINRHGWQLLSVTQSEEAYTVFFGRPADGQVRRCNS